MTEPGTHARRAAELAEEALHPRTRPRRAQLLAAVAQVHATLAAGTAAAAPAPMAPAAARPPRPARQPVPAETRGRPAPAAPGGPVRVQPSGRTTLFERLKGQDGISLVVQEFYTRVLRDPQLTHYFEGVAMWRLQRHMVAFLVQATGGPAAYDGRDMAVAHAGLHITARDFDRVARHLVETLNSFGVDSADVDEVVAAIGPLKQYIVTAAPGPVLPDPG